MAKNEGVAKADETNERVRRVVHGAVTAMVKRATVNDDFLRDHLYFTLQEQAPDAPPDELLERKHMGFAVFCSRLVGIAGAGWEPPAETDPPEAIRSAFVRWLALDAALVEAIAQAIRDLNRAPNADPASVAPEHLTEAQRADPN